MLRIRNKSIISNSSSTFVRTTVRPARLIEMKSGCGTWILRPSARQIVNGRHGAVCMNFFTASGLMAVLIHSRSNVCQMALCVESRVHPR